MSYAHSLGTMYELCSCMIFSLSCMINVDHSLYHDPYKVAGEGEVVEEHGSQLGDYRSINISPTDLMQIQK